MAKKGLGVAIEDITPDTVRNAGFYANQALSGAASAIANAATRSLAEGSSFGDNVLAALPDVIGSTIGNLIADPITAKMDAARERAQSQNDPVAAEGEVDEAVYAEDNGYTDTVDNAQLVPSVLYYEEGVDPLDELFLLAGGGGQNSRVRMGGNGGPPLTDPRTGQVLGIPLTNGPAGAIWAPIDGFLDITGPANRALSDLADAERRAIRREILSLDPNWRPPASARAPGPESLQAKINDLISYREQRAFVRYRVRGDVGPLQQETLRVYQNAVNEGFDQAIGLLREGRLSIPRGWSREQALGSHVDRFARQTIRSWYYRHGVSEGGGQAVAVNRRLPTNEVEASFRIPDVRVGNIAFDATLSPKSINTPQVRGYLSNPNTAGVIIVRPQRIGQSYLIPRQR
jgi:hypothetical protein